MMYLHKTCNIPKRCYFFSVVAFAHAISCTTLLVLNSQLICDETHKKFLCSFIVVEFLRVIYEQSFD